jgi:hypothetical protein
MVQESIGPVLTGLSCTRQRRVDARQGRFYILPSASNSAS